MFHPFTFSRDKKLSEDDTGKNIFFCNLKELTKNEEARLILELKIPFMNKEKKSIFEFLNFLRVQRCFNILDRDESNTKEKPKKYPKTLIFDPRAKKLDEKDKPRFISFLGRRKKWPIKAIAILSLSKKNKYFDLYIQKLHL